MGGLGTKTPVLDLICYRFGESHLTCYTLGSLSPISTPGLQKNKGRHSHSADPDRLEE